MRIRPAHQEDAAQISALLQDIANVGKRTRPTDAGFVLTHYIAHNTTIQCTVFDDGSGTLLGMQSLKRAVAGNLYGVTPGWGIIGTHVRPSAARRGVGRTLFAETHQVARASGLEWIDASIAAHNEDGLAYYEAMGFRTYRTPRGKICKRFDVGA